MTKEQAFAESKRMMQGQKWKAFVLDLSFIGWYILSGLTLGILAIFYVSPYVNATHAALYEALCYANPAGSNGFTQQEDPVNSPFRKCLLFGHLRVICQKVRNHHIFICFYNTRNDKKQ